MHQCGDTVLGSVSGSLCGREDQEQASVFPLRVALFLHDDAEGKQRCTTGKEGARKSAGVFLCLPVHRRTKALIQLLGAMNCGGRLDCRTALKAWRSMGSQASRLYKNQLLQCSGQGKLVGNTIEVGM